MSRHGDEQPSANSSAAEEVSFADARHDATAVPELYDELIDVHLDAHADQLDQPFYSAERFGERLHNYAAGAGFELVTGRVDGLMVGYAFGSPLPATTRWWEPLEEAGEADAVAELIRETGPDENGGGYRTFAFREFLVRKGFQRRGYGRRLHDVLLADRPEERATLLVRPDNPARQLYLRWGWTRVGYLQPFADSPRFWSMVLTLR
jgi:GNAT superfamily N-acetyltransferase